MKRLYRRIGIAVVSLALLCTGAAAETADDLSYTMSEKLMKQLSAGSGFVGTLTLSAAAAAGREGDAFSTVKPLNLEWTYIQTAADEAMGTPGETRVRLTFDQSEYQQGSAELSLQNGAAYLKSSLLGDAWYLAGDGGLQTLAANSGAATALPGASELSLLKNLLPGAVSFLQPMAAYLLNAETGGMGDALQQYVTKIDFWLEGYRDSVQMIGLTDGASVMQIGYRLPSAAVKAQLKQLLIDLMNDETLLPMLRALMPAEQAALYLNPELQPYYFYAVDGLPLDGDLVIHRTVSFLGDTEELIVSMPLYDSVAGAMTLTYVRGQGGADMPQEQTVTLAGADSRAELIFRAYDTMTGASVVQGTLKVEGAQENGVKPQTLWASFDVNTQTVTTRDLNGYETQNMSLKVSVAPMAIPQGEDAAAYAAFSKTDLALELKIASLPAKNASTDVEAKLTLSGEGMAQSVTAELAGSTTALWTPEAFDAQKAVNLAAMPQDELQTLLSQAVVKAGLLFLPYVNLPLATTVPTP